jgi:Tol biopolymer transport system component
MSRVIRFGAFELDTGAGELRKHGVRLKLQDQPLVVLTTLIEASGEVVTREELIRRLWPNGVHVDFDRGLNAAVNRLRQVLGDSAENPRYIETLARRGYRFLAPIDAPPATAVPETAAPRQPRRWPLWAAAAAAIVLVALSIYGFAVRRAIRQSPPSEAYVAVPLTSFPGYEITPTLSPDGSQVAFAWTGPGLANSDIYIKVIGPGEPVRLTNDPAGDLSPAWSPDGRWIAFLRESATSPSGYTLIVVPALGGAERTIGTIVHLPYLVRSSSPGAGLVQSWLSWTPDGQWILASDSDAERGPQRLIAFNVSSGEVHGVTKPVPGTLGDGDPAVSPDGRSVAFLRVQGAGRGDLFVVDIDRNARPAGAPRRITRIQAGICDVVWTPDGRALVFSIGAARRTLWRVPADGTAEPVRVPVATDFASGVAISPGGRLVYVQRRVNSDLWRIAASGRRPPVPLVVSTFSDVNPQVSPDGRRIAFGSNRSGEAQVWLANADGSQPHQLTDGRGWDSGTPRWSPDGRFIAFDANAGGSYDIYVVPATGGAPRRLTNSPVDDVIPSWSQDGRWIYFSSRRTGRPELFKIPAAGGEAIQVTNRGGWMAFESYDGRDLYYTGHEGRGEVWRKPASGGRESVVLTGLAGRRFAVARTGIYFFREETPRRVSLAKYDFATQQTRTLTTFDRRLSAGIAVTPDEHSVIFTQLEDEGSDLMMVENFH